MFFDTTMVKFTIFVQMSKKFDELKNDASTLKNQKKPKNLGSDDKIDFDDLSEVGIHGTGPT